MLGDGIVSFATAVETVSRRKAKSSPKIGSSIPSLPSTCIPEKTASMSPSSLWKWTAICSSGTRVTPPSR